ncbi:SDR family oxidoreductase [Agrococcus sp. ARC_14]|uniref:SDR family NAD(P)-dependent oxidoreductase n=1 Tax=Agrococcus sp. ARC_14 TaxID=2919927 RepID=UPI001F06F8BC|nr:SDR family oxidoreductase [Agrococcus sp. ARC_14]MCH1881375.1 SDR family oxidoreductase [Agrococcus sp. ARC_14]
MTNTPPLRSAIVTGGGGGIGSVIARRLAETGYAVVVADTSEEAAARVAASLHIEDGAAGHAVVAGDLTLRAVNRRAVDAAIDLAPLGAIVNAVGIAPKDAGMKREFQDISEDEWDLIMAVNVKAPMLLVQEALAHLPVDGTASIVNLLSITSKLGTGGRREDTFPPLLPSSVAYAASKAALQNMTASLGREFASRRIRVNGVAPGFVATTMTGGMPDEQTRTMTAQIPMARFGQPDEIADAIEFLLSPKAAYITGASLDINGGMLTC